MGTRLYPMAKENKIIEILAGVPAGSVEAMELFKKELIVKFPDTNQIVDQIKDPKYLRWSALNDHPVFGVIDNFLSEGWGKFGWGLVTKFGHEEFSGIATNAEEVKALLISAGKFDIATNPEQVNMLVESGGVWWG